MPSPEMNMLFRWFKLGVMTFSSDGVVSVTVNRFWPQHQQNQTDPMFNVIFYRKNCHLFHQWIWPRSVWGLTENGRTACAKRLPDYYVLFVNCHINITDFIFCFWIRWCTCFCVLGWIIFNIVVSCQQVISTVVKQSRVIFSRVLVFSIVFKLKVVLKSQHLKMLLQVFKRIQALTRHWWCLKIDFKFGAISIWKCIILNLQHQKSNIA